jgi:predicted HicB family RNase H-like nuclease
MNALHHKGYAGVFTFEPDDDAFHGEIVGIRDVIHFSGRSVDELRAAFQEAVEDYLATCAEIGKEPDKPYSGRFVVRVTPEIHRLAETAAKASGKSLNAFASEALEHAARSVQSAH